jgi:transposase
MQMKAYSIDLREKIVQAVASGTSIRQTAERFMVSKSLVQKLLKQKKEEGHVIPHQQGGYLVSPLLQFEDQIREIVAQHNDATLAEYCELVGEATGEWVSLSTMCRTLQRLELPRKKNAARQSSRK